MLRNPSCIGMEALSIDTLRQLDDRRLILIFAVIMVFAFLLLRGIASDPDVNSFYNYMMMIKDGQVPYKDFDFEFPPCMLIIYALPGIFTSDHGTYVLIFGALSTVFAVGLLAV